MRNITADCTREALGFIDRNNKQPFFLYMPYSMPHVPLFASRKWTGRTGNGIYADVIAEIDDSIGQILARVKQLGLTDDTLVIFTSDNGPWLSYGEHAGSRGELREGKGTSWEGGIRVPMIASWPGVIPKGMVTTQPAMTIDIFPTLRRIVGAAPGKNTIDGHDIGENLAAGDTAGADERVYWTYYNTNELQAVRKGRWKLILPHTYRTLINQPVAKGGKPVSYTNVKTPLALYDIYADPAETLDMSAKRPVVLRAMLAEAERARVELGDTLTGKARGRGTRPPGLVS
jgi:arylsulfatase